LIAALFLIDPGLPVAQAQTLGQAPPSGTASSQAPGTTLPVVSSSQGKSTAEITQQLEKLDQIAKGFVDEANRILVDQQQLTFEVQRGTRALEEGCKNTKRSGPTSAAVVGGGQASPVMAGNLSSDAIRPITVRVRDLQSRLSSAEQSQCTTVSRLKGSSLESCGSLSIMGQWANQANRFLAIRQQQMGERARLLDVVGQLEKEQCVGSGFSSKLIKQVETQSMQFDQRAEQLLESFIRLGSEIAARPGQPRSAGS